MRGGDISHIEALLLGLLHGMLGFAVGRRAAALHQEPVAEASR